MSLNPVQPTDYLDYFGIEEDDQEQTFIRLPEGNFTTCTKAVCETLGISYQDVQTIMNEQ